MFLQRTASQLIPGTSKTSTVGVISNLVRGLRIKFQRPYLGIYKTDGDYVRENDILCVQKHMNYHPGLNVSHKREQLDRFLRAQCAGRVYITTEKIKPDLSDADMMHYYGDVMDRLPDKLTFNVVADEMEPRFRLVDAHCTSSLVVSYVDRMLDDILQSMVDAPSDIRGLALDMYAQGFDACEAPTYRVIVNMQQYSMDKCKPDTRRARRYRVDVDLEHGHDRLDELLAQAVHQCRLALDDVVDKIALDTFAVVLIHRPDYVNETKIENLVGCWSRTWHPYSNSEDVPCALRVLASCNHSCLKFDAVLLDYAVDVNQLTLE